ncbi:hypothetical protein LPB140_01215 [Sphingorhabdus lutea]|uniref:Uncharacterized protein n=1 Tax=Sphingorhabdus lutea TaxID=1913578 RepID=A0A1L3J997_9SPHN|nr:hypothetical protein LPB140_01215 [Sphingorhabdus lutea]
MGASDIFCKEAKLKKDGDKIEVDEEEASGGVKEHGVRYVLAISLVLVVIVLSLSWIIPALMKPTGTG